MTNLDCSVKNCTYNKDDCCCRNNINVDGPHAKVTEETCCKSFAERKGDTSISEVEEAKKPTNVACNASNCIYNEDCYCDAEHIGIAGRDACCCTGTECASFRCK